MCWKRDKYRILLACDIVGSDSHNEGGYDGSEIHYCVADGCLGGFGSC